ncbi:MAG TPA: DUF3105 domain-containing protein [Kofleriaceae bacterium]|jgi:hypothetical protein
MRAGTTLLALLVASALACGDDGSASPVDADRRDAGPCEAFPVENEGWMHVPEDSTIDYQHNPPASGPHYPVWSRYQVHEEPLARGYWVHNLEHGAIVLVYRSDAPAATVEALRAAWEAIPLDPICRHRRSLVVADPDLDDQVAVVAADWAIEGDCIDQDAILDFVDQHRNHAPEQVCGDGVVP